MSFPTYEVIIIGGSFAGLSAAMSLGRASRKVLIIDNQLPCNRQTPHSHNFLTQDGEAPLTILEKSRQQVAAYPTIEFKIGTVSNAVKTADLFEVTLQNGAQFSGKKLLIAAGIKDDTSQIKGLSECWGITVIHCPYCHGFEVKGLPTAVVANGNDGFEYAKMIFHWTQQLTLCTNGPSTLSEEQLQTLLQRGISVMEEPIEAFIHSQGQLEHLLFQNEKTLSVAAAYFRPPFVQSGDFSVQLGYELTPQGYIQVNEMQQTSQPGVYAAGDNTSPFRSVANAVAKGSMAGAVINRELIEESF